MRAIAIRGISDFADGEKAALERKSDGSYRAYAARNAFSFLEAQIATNHFLVDELIAIKYRTFNKTPIAAPVENDQDIIAAAVKNCNDEIISNLRILSPEFRSSQKGYVLPTPRVYSYDNRDFETSKSKLTQLNPEDIISKSTTSLVHIPRTYPDDGLPWVFADHLLKSDTLSQRAIPFVLNYDDIRAPNKSVTDILNKNYNWNKLADIQSVKRVVIISNFDTDAKSKLKFFERNFNFPEDVSCILISGQNKPIELEEISIEHDNYMLTDVSYYAIYDFIEKQFSQTSEEAEVIAYRLYDLFDKFGLTAHPTYFAELPENTLSALLKANRRAELLQFAVDGFLMFLVADDQSQIVLTRTTRKRFLARLALELKVEKRSFNTIELAELVDTFAEEHDFPLDRKSFVEGFLEKGIIQFTDDKVRFSMPFIEHYLLAEALSKDENTAVRYFNFDEDVFDVATFDLYCEMARTDVLCESLIARIEDRIQDLVDSSGERASFLATSGGFEIFERLAKRGFFERKWKSEFESDKTSKDRALEKSRQLDELKAVGAQVRSEAVRRQSKGELRDERVNADTKNGAYEDGYNVHGAVGRDWALGVILLGKGAEQLKAPQKRKLAALLIELLALGADLETERRAGVDFKKSRNEIKESDAYKQLMDGFDENGVKKNDMERLLDTVLDFAEAAFVSGYLYGSLQFLAEEARHEVLKQTIDSVETKSNVSELIKGTWQVEVDSAKGGGNDQESTQ